MGVSPRMLRIKTSHVVKRLNLTTPFKENVPGYDWFRGLARRHPEVSVRKQEPLSHSRARMLNSTTVEEYFVDLQKLLTKLKLFNKPAQIFSMDETGIQMEHVPTNVVARKGSKIVPGRVSNNRENITVIACVNALGTAMPPMVIAKGKTYKSLLNFVTSDAPQGTIFTYSEKAWTDGSLGTEWFRNIFLKNCGSERPILLVLDGHRSHETLDILELAVGENIEILCLPPHTTHFLQPLDRTVFGPMSSAYNRHCTEYMSENPTNVVCKKSWAKLFKKAWESSMTEANIKSGFRACGIYPYNPAAVPKAALKPSTQWNVSVAPGTPAPAQPIGPKTAQPSTSQETDTAERMEAAELITVEDKTGQEEDVSCIRHDHDYESTVDSIFKLAPVTVVPSAAKSKLVTSHRILTSEEVITLKREAAEKKAPVKQKQLKASRGTGKELQKQETGEDDEYLCAVCRKPYKKRTTLSWVQCTTCEEWMHLKCIPPELVSDDIFEPDVPFHCHLH